MELIDPTVEMSSDALRKVIEHCIEFGRTLIGYHGGDDRMAERGFTGAEIHNTLLKGRLATDQCVAGKWRYLATHRDAATCFTFDVDDDGNMLVIVTLIRKGV